ncbi:hypothetical protein Bind_1766 [Beijerinckia indica subsp. indica ATCC 9039]|uniref:Uncharacterized protein n=1 Tax=Beijerinckia indica subsp. indica (strain ATCC 9039 / DSM 1715 / NCIMB 8712) TaxID=395963 RepID=B2ICX3_BEII9|nr:hypothetical protein Bind_1766 [Beijerinckia indica subsp. indica ATCC 9039]
MEKTILSGVAAHSNNKILRLRRTYLFAAIFFAWAPCSYAEDCEAEKKRVEAADPDTTVVCEDRPVGYGAPSGPSGGGDEGSNTGSGHEGGGGGGGRQQGAQRVVEPDAFQFKRCPGNTQWSYCTAIRFVGGVPPAFVDVGVTVNAPLIRRDGNPLVAQEAQLDSAIAASTTATYFMNALKSHAVSPSEVSALFSKHMDQVIRSTGIGYRVQRCNPVPNPPPPC